MFCKFIHPKELAQKVQKEITMETDKIVSPFGMLTTLSVILKETRANIAVLKSLNSRDSPLNSRELSIAITDIETGYLWLKDAFQYLTDKNSNDDQTVGIMETVVTDEKMVSDGTQNVSHETVNDNVSHETVNDNVSHETSEPGEDTTEPGENTEQPSEEVKVLTPEEIADHLKHGTC